MHKTHRRFRGYDYARGGSMFVTTCLEHRHPLFGRVDHKRVGRFKQMSHYHIAGRAPGIWEEGYHDLICTSERMNRTVDAYIRNNPLKWWLMHGDRSLMHVVEPFVVPEAGDESLWRAVGNFELLDRERLVSLRISQKVPQTALPQVVEVCSRAALEKGYTYLSTFFSPGERMVFKALAELEEVPMIRQEGSHAVDD